MVKAADWIRIDYPNVRIVPKKDGWYKVMLKCGREDNSEFRVIADTWIGSGGIVVAWREYVEGYHE